MAHIKGDYNSKILTDRQVEFSWKGSIERGKNPDNQRSTQFHVSGHVRIGKNKCNEKDQKKLAEKVKKVIHKELHDRKITKESLERKVRKVVKHCTIKNLNVTVSPVVFKKSLNISVPPSVPTPTPSASLPRNQNLQSHNNATLQPSVVPEKVTRETLAICNKEELAKLIKSFDLLHQMKINLNNLSDQRILDTIGNALEIKGEMTLNEKKAIVEKEISRAMNETAPNADEDLPSDLFLYLTNLSDRVGQIQGQ